MTGWMRHDPTEDEGVPVRNSAGRWLRLAFPDHRRRPGIRWALPSPLSAVGTGFAMTVHNPQGSAFTHAALGATGPASAGADARAALRQWRRAAHGPGQPGMRRTRGIRLCTVPTGSADARR
jgi:hypothetical protein